MHERQGISKRKYNLVPVNTAEQFNQSTEKNAFLKKVLIPKTHGVGCFISFYKKEIGSSLKNKYEMALE